MRQKLIWMAFVALGAMASVPAIASAAPVLTENGVKLEVGAKVTATNDGEAIFNAGGITANCKSFWTTSTLVKNDATNGIESTIENGAASGCTSSMGALDLTFPGATNEGGSKHMCIKTTAGADKGELLGRGCNEAGSGEMTIAVTVTSSGLKCLYKRSAGVSGSFTTNSAPATLRFEGAPEFVKVESSFLCPASAGLIQLAFNIYTDNEIETPLSIS